MPRAWEVVRTLHYVCKLDRVACRTFLDAYRGVLPLTLVEQLGKLGEDAPLEPLLTALDDPHVSVRKEALTRLG